MVMDLVKSNWINQEVEVIKTSLPYPEGKLIISYGYWIWFAAGQIHIWRKIK